MRHFLNITADISQAKYLQVLNIDYHIQLNLLVPQIQAMFLFLLQIKYQKHLLLQLLLYEDYQ